MWELHAPTRVCYKIHCLCRHRKVNDEENVPNELLNEYVQKILNYVLYDVENSKTLLNFEPIKMNTHCIFSQNSLLWGAPDYRYDLSLETNVER